MLVVFVAAIGAMRMPYVFAVFTDPRLPFPTALRVTSALFVFMLQNMTPAALAFTVLTSLLIGINSALLVYYVRRFGGLPQTRNVAGGAFGSALAFAIALFGFGCLSCGSVFVASLIAALGGAGLLAAVPYLGAGVGTLGVILLLLSVFYLARAIEKPPVCAV